MAVFGMNRSRNVAGAVLLACALSCRQAEGGEGGADDGGGSPQRVEVGLQAPAYRAMSLDGAMASLAQHRGRAVLLNVWATWCVPCRVELPVLQRLHQRYGGAGLDVIGVNVDAVASRESIRTFAHDLDVSYTIWLDPKNVILKRYSVIGLPATFVIGRDGTVLYKYLGPLKEGDPAMHRVIEQALVH
jgi:cytochrome c biogenesis protein CcmG, thiol:disulfide interchange protein DsbE